jgi:hypothetical protein
VRPILDQNGPLASPPRRCHRNSPLLHEWRLQVATIYTQLFGLYRVKSFAHSRPGKTETRQGQGIRRTHPSNGDAAMATKLPGCQNFEQITLRCATVGQKFFRMPSSASSQRRLLQHSIWCWSRLSCNFIRRFAPRATLKELRIATRDHRFRLGAVMRLIWFETRNSDQS